VLSRAGPDAAGGFRHQAGDTPGRTGPDLRFSGFFSGSIAEGVATGIARAFERPMRITAPADPGEPTIPEGADFIGAIVYPSGDFGLLFCDTLAGRFGAVLARRAMEGMLE
jgi:hypothetical protein